MFEDKTVPVGQALRRLRESRAESADNQSITEQVRMQTLQLIHAKKGGVPRTMEISELLHFVHQAEDIINQEAIAEMVWASEQPFDSYP